MKILRLSTFLDFGGVETRLANISHIQDENEWIFVCMNKEGKAAQAIRANNKRVINLHSKPSIYSFNTFLKIYNVIKKEKPDVVHTSGAEANFHGILVAKLAGVKTIIGEEIGTPNHGRKARFIFSNIYKLANYVIGNSDAVLKVVHEIDNVPYSKLKKIANPIIFKELPEKNRREKDQNDFRIVMISRLEPVKNIEGVFNVLSKLIKDQAQIKLTIAGSGSLEKELNQKIIELGLQNHVDFVGFITNPYPYLVNSDLYILNSFSEGFSNSLVEAMYSKTPSLSTAVGSAPEMIEDGVNGFIVAVDDEEVLYKKLKAISTMSQTEREEIALRGHQTVVENFSLEKHIASLMDIYKA